MFLPPFPWSIAVRLPFSSRSSTQDSRCNRATSYRSADRLWFLGALFGLSLVLASVGSFVLAHPQNEFMKSEESLSMPLPSRIVSFVPGLSDDSPAVVLLDRNGAWLAAKVESDRNWTFNSQPHSQTSLSVHSAVVDDTRHAWLVASQKRSISWMTAEGDSIAIEPAPNVMIDRWIELSSSEQVLGLSCWGRCLVRGTWVDSSQPHPTQITWEYLDLPLSPTYCAVDGYRAWIGSEFDSRVVEVDLTSLKIQSQASHTLGSITDLKWDQARNALWACSTRVEESAATDSSHFDDRSVVIHELTRIDLANQSTLPWSSEQLHTTRLAQGNADPLEIFVRDDRVDVVMGGGGGVESFACDSLKSLATWKHESPLTDAWENDAGLIVASRFTGEIVQIDSQLHPFAMLRLQQPDATYRERGEALFFSASASQSREVSCSSCHRNGHTNSMLADTLGDGTYGTPKLVPSLLGTADTDPWGWLGNRKEIGDQVARSFEETQHYPLSGQQTREVIGYLFQLEPPPMSRVDALSATDSDRMSQGREAFDRHCATCHVAPLTFTTNGTFDVGLRDEQGVERFNPPSLRGVGQRSRFFHDGQATSLEEAVFESDHPPGFAVDEATRQSLLVYLKSL